MGTDHQRIKRFRARAFERQGGLCYWCSEPMIVKTQANAAKVWNDPRVCTADHLIIRSDGGRTTEDNIVAACRECNNRRHVSVSGWPWLDGLLACRGIAIRPPFRSRNPYEEAP